VQAANWQTSILRNLSAAQCINTVACRGLQDIYLDVLAAIPPLPHYDLIELSNGKALAINVIFTTMSNIHAALSCIRMQDYWKKTRANKKQRCTFNKSR
jgi:hypothetical protein